MSEMLEVRNVSKSFDGVAANRHISLVVPKGAIVGLIGPNGSGKTTLFNSIVGHHAIDEGSIRFERREISRLRTPQIARLRLIRTFQHTRVYRAMTCLDNMLISAPPARRGVAALFERIDESVAERAHVLLRFVALEQKCDEAAGSLSFGQQKLLELAMALMAQPKLLLLDEPTAGINPTLINVLIDRLKRINADFGVTLLIIEHNIRAITSLAQRIYCLAHGELLTDDTPERLVNDPRVIDAYLGAT